ncbi:unnamed protein product [Closterium sp. NIES-53]
MDGRRHTGVCAGCSGLLLQQPASGRERSSGAETDTHLVTEFRDVSKHASDGLFPGCRPIPWVPVYSLGAGLFPGCRSIPWVPVYSLGAGLFPGCRSIPWVPVYSLGAGLFPGCRSIPWVPVYSLGAGLFPGSRSIPWVPVYSLGARDYFFSNPLLSLRQPAAPTAPQQCSSSPPCSPCPTLSSCFSLLPPPAHSRLHHQLDTLLELKATSGPHCHTAVLIYPSLLSLLYPSPLFLSSSLSPTTSSTPYCSSRQPAAPTAPQQCSSSPPCSQYHNISHFSLSSLVPPLLLSPSHHQLDTLLQLKATSGPHCPTAVLIFPEGTRSITGSLQPFKSGVGLLAEQLDVPVVPVCVKRVPLHTAVLRFPEGSCFLIGPLHPFKSGMGLLEEQLDVPVVPVFPEGSCFLIGPLHPFKSGVGLLAEQLDVPATLSLTHSLVHSLSSSIHTASNRHPPTQGTFEALPKGRTIPLRRRVTVEFGRPLDVQEYLQVAQVAPPDAAVVSPPASTQVVISAAAVAAASFGGVSPQGISQASYAAAASLLACVPVQPGETAGLAAALALCFALLIAGFRPVASWAWPYLFFPSDDQEEVP